MRRMLVTSPRIAVGAVLISWSMLKSRWSPAESHVDLISGSGQKVTVSDFQISATLVKQSPK